MGGVLGLCEGSLWLPVLPKAQLAPGGPASKGIGFEMHCPEVLQVCGLASCDCRVHNPRFYSITAATIALGIPLVPCNITWAL